MIVLKKFLFLCICCFLVFSLTVSADNSALADRYGLSDTVSAFLTRYGIDLSGIDGINDLPEDLITPYQPLIESYIGQIESFGMTDSQVHDYVLSAIGSAKNQLTAPAEPVRVIVPTYTCVLNNSAVWYADSLYPLISYKDITYFPMTWDYCRALGLSSDWREDSGLYIAYQPSYGELPIYETSDNSGELFATLPTYPIYINGKRINNNAADYPLLNFRDVTYFPMTWDYAHEEFAWDTAWEDGCFSLSSGLFDGSLTLNFESADDTGAVMSRYEQYEIENEDGSFTPVGTLSYQRLDFATGALTETDAPAEEEAAGSESVPCTVEDGCVYLSGRPLPEITGLGEYDEVSAYVSVVGDARFYTVWVLKVDKSQGAYSYRNTRYDYVRLGDALSFIGNNLLIGNATWLGDDLYFTAQPVIYMIRTHVSPRSTLYRLDGGGTLSPILFTDFSRVLLLGEAKDKLYLKCMWCPENGVTDEFSVVPSKDGYFTFDGETLTKIADYRYTDVDLLTPQGDIYAIIDWCSALVKIR